MRIKILYIIILVNCYYVANAQLQSLSSQYITNGMAINPAFAGADEALSTTLVYRNQWAGFEGAPTTITASIHSPLRNELIGIGLLVVSDQIGPYSETSLLANYAYKVKTSRYSKLSFGIGLGITLLDVDLNNLDPTDQDDLELIEMGVKGANPNFSAGIYYNTREFFLGVSIPFFLSYAYTGKDSDQLELKNDLSEYNFHITSGYKIKLDHIYTFYPTLLMKYHPGNTFQADLSGQLGYREKIWLGLTYRTINDFAVLLQVQASDQLKIAYSYDMGITRNDRYYGGSHEILLKYVFDFRARVVGPRRF